MNKNIVGIISDSHDNRTNIAKAVEIFNKKGTSLVVHAGDVISPFTVLDFKHLDCPMEIVFGNNDGERIGLAGAFGDLGTILPGPRTFIHNEKCFLLMHEHECVQALSTSDSIDYVIYGHIHEVDIRKGTPMIINPGESGGWLKGRSTIAVLDLSTREAEIIDLNP